MPDGWAKVGTEWRRLHGEEALWLSVWLSAGAGGWITYHPHSFPTVSENSPWEIVLSSLHTWPSLSILLCFTFPPPPPPLFFFLTWRLSFYRLKILCRNYFEQGWSSTAHVRRTCWCFGWIPLAALSSLRVRGRPWVFLQIREYSLSFPPGFVPTLTTMTL